MYMSHGIEQRGQSYYAWDPPGQALSVLLNLRLVDVIRRWIDEASAAGEEAGGLLLGSIRQESDRSVITIDNCEPVRIAHQYGPLFAVTGEERARLVQRFAARPAGETTPDMAPVGYIRSHARNGLYLDSSDTELLRDSPLDAVFLLVRPGPEPQAGFFVRQNDDGYAYHGFPFERRIRRQQNGGLAALRLRLSRVSKAPARVAAVAACALIVLAGTTYLGWQSQASPAPPRFGLNVQRSGRELRLTWNPQAVHGKAVLWVNDGPSRRRIDLDQAQVTLGSAVYVPGSDEVNFRLEAQDTSDSIWSIGASPAPPDQVVRRPDQMVKIEPVKAAPAFIPEPKPPKVTLASADRTVPRPVLSAVSTPAPRPAPEVAIAHPLASAAPAASAAPKALPVTPAPVYKRDAFGQVVANRPSRDLDPTVTVSYAAPPETASARHGIQKVPVLRLLKHPHGNREGFEPARPVGDLRPVVFRQLAHQLPGDWRVDVQASVDKHGRVSNVELISPQADQRLVRLATEAVSRSLFYPAQSDGHDVGSKLIVTFRFKNPAQLEAATKASGAEGR
jgi:Gram-negative bacterial TonB protein C-terminal